MHNMTNCDKLAEEFQEKFGADLKKILLTIDNLQDDLEDWKNAEFYDGLSHDTRDWYQDEAQKCETFNYAITKFIDEIGVITQFFNKLKY